MRKYLNFVWEIIGMAAVIVFAYLTFCWMASDKKVSQYELGRGGYIHINIDNDADKSVPTFGMTTEEVVNLINDLNESLPNK